MTEQLFQAYYLDVDKKAETVLFVGNYEEATKAKEKAEQAGGAIKPGEKYSFGVKPATLAAIQATKKKPEPKEKTAGKDTKDA
jgi:glycogen debranching enzyme